MCGVPLPAGLVESDRLPEPIFTPTTKAAEGHDLPLTPDETADLVGRGLAERLEGADARIYERIAAIAAERGIILADTKFEFGFCDGELILIDEVGTPDSSRFWPADGYAPGGPQPSFDKQFVRDWLDAERMGPRAAAAGAARRGRGGARRRKYREAYERLTGEPCRAYLARRIGAVDAEEGRMTFTFEVLVSLKPGWPTRRARR